jgi:transcription initiation factor TFIIB
VCDSDSFSTLFDEVEAICENCGIVIYDWNDPSLAEESIDCGPLNNDQNLSWSEVRPAYNSTEHRFGTAVEHIEDIAEELAISDSVRIKAAEMYVDAALEGITNGRSIPVVAASSLYISSRAAEQPRSLKRIADEAEIDQKQLNKTVRKLSTQILEAGTTNTITEPEAHLDFLCSDLCLDTEAGKNAESLLQHLRENLTLDGKHPAGIAAAAIYLTAESPPPQRKLAASAGVAVETVRLRLNEFRAAGGIDDV